MYTANAIRNVVLLGHSGSGKSALAESLLYMTGAIDRMGKNADGNTVCDYDPEEIRRNISIATSVVPLEYKNTKINLMDAPGGFDFSGAAMEALRAADAAILVLASKDGLTVGFEKAWKYCEDRNMPRFIYISKVDEDNADYNATFALKAAEHAGIRIRYASTEIGGSGLVGEYRKVGVELTDLRLHRRHAFVGGYGAEGDMVSTGYVHGLLTHRAGGAEDDQIGIQRTYVHIILHYRPKTDNVVKQTKSMMDTASTESKRSITPPWPGNTLPKSLMPYLRLSRDRDKSPIWDTMETSTPITAMSTRDSFPAPSTTHRLL